MSAAAAVQFVPPPDKTPPRLKLLGTGTPAITASGAIIMLENATWGTRWTDPGATAHDAVDGNLTDAIQSFGAGAVDTSVPTPQGRDFSFVIEYSVEDRSRNAAPLARRLVRVVCPRSETLCIDPDTGTSTCTVRGVCGAPAALTATTRTGRAADAVTTTASSPPSAPAPPTISLLAPGPAVVSVGSVYDRCADSAPISAVCERGVAAEDARDGNLERQVLVCGNRCVTAAPIIRSLDYLLVIGVSIRGCVCCRPACTAACTHACMHTCLYLYGLAVPASPDKCVQVAAAVRAAWGTTISCLWRVNRHARGVQHHL